MNDKRLKKEPLYNWVCRPISIKVLVIDVRIILRALRFECISTDVTSVVNSIQAPSRHPEDSA